MVGVDMSEWKKCGTCRAYAAPTEKDMLGTCHLYPPGCALEFPPMEPDEWCLQWQAKPRRDQLIGRQVKIVGGSFAGKTGIVMAGINDRVNGQIYWVSTDDYGQVVVAMSNLEVA